MKTLYLVHDLSDPAVRRRVIMLQAGGAEVTLAGFRRGEFTAGFDNLAPIELGKTIDGKFGQRIAEVAKAGYRLAEKLNGISKPDIIVARTLEMLALAHRANALFSSDIPIVYECLDIHRLLLRKDAIGRTMRWAERRLAHKAALLLTSSPAFVREYFEPYGQVSAPVILLQNKVLDLDPGRLPVAPGPRGSNQPWKIGWFGALRCRKSLETLAAFTRRMDGKFEVILRGRPAYSEFNDFSSLVAFEPHMRFEGPYRNPEDLADIYGGVDFSWAIDFFEEGMNSDWLLPNRLYEGCRYGVVPIALEGTETARFLARHQIGILLPDASPDIMSDRMSAIDAESYAAERQAITEQKTELWTCSRDDCRILVNQLKSLCGTRPSNAMSPVAA